MTTITLPPEQHEHPALTGHALRMPVVFACPLCGTALTAQAANQLRCPHDQTSYPCVDGIWRLLPPERASLHGPFLEQYTAVRQAEGHGSSTSAYYRALPYRDLTGRQRWRWRIRARSFQMLLRHVIVPLEQRRGTALTILDAGAGNGWARCA